MKRMRCSRRSGVILYSFDNGHFMAYTSPPPTAEPLLKEKPFGECTFQLSPIAVQRLHSYSTRPRGTLILIGAGWRSQTEGETFKGTDGACADPDTRIFPATGAGGAAGGRQVARATPSFIQSAFTSTAQPSLILSWAPRKNRSPSSLLPFVPPRPTQKAPPDGRGFACGVKP